MSYVGGPFWCAVLQMFFCKRSLWVWQARLESVSPIIQSSNPYAQTWCYFPSSIWYEHYDMQWHCFIPIKSSCSMGHLQIIFLCCQTAWMSLMTPMLRLLLFPSYILAHALLQPITPFIQAKCYIQSKFVINWFQSALS